MILLIKTSDKCCYYGKIVPTQEDLDKEKASNMKQGYIGIIKQDNFTFGNLELNLKHWARVEISDESWDEKWISSIVNEDNEITQLRKYYLPLTSIFTEQEYNNIKNGILQEHDVIKINNISELILLVDYNNRPEEFGMEW